MCIRDSLSTEQANIFEFEDVKTKAERYRKGHYSYEEPYIKEEGQDQSSPAERSERKKSRGTVPKLNNPRVINDLENQPAYLRRNIKLNKVPHSSEDAHSNWSVSDEEEPDITSSNSFLHGNVD